MSREQCKVITLCGSTRFKDEFIKTQERLTLEGHIVLSVALFSHADKKHRISKETKQMLDELHKKKIEMSDGIFVIDVDKYIGESTRSEIEYAKELGLPIDYYSDWTLQNNLERLEKDKEYQSQYPDLIQPLKPHLKEQIKSILPKFSRQPIVSFMPDGTIQLRWELKRYEGTTKIDILAYTFDGTDRVKIEENRYGNNNRKPKPIYQIEDVYNILNLDDMIVMVKEFYNKSTEDVLAENEKAEDKT